jgi:hypothetical protein
MTFKYYTLQTSLPTSPSAIMIDAFQNLLNEQFSVATNIYSVQEESPVTSGSYQNLNVRVLTAIDSETSEKLGDDWKTFLFQDIGHATPVGTKYYFNNSYWIIINSEIYKNLAAGATVRRANNTLRFVDINNNYIIEPCIIDYKLTFPRNKESDPILPQGIMTIYCQSNSLTRQVRENQRFLFGNTDQWNCYRVLGGGIRNFLNNETLDNDSSPLIELTLQKTEVNVDTDDLINGICDYIKYTYNITTSPSSIIGTIGDSYQLLNEITLNGNPVLKDVNYLSSSSTVLVSGSGLVTLIADGISDIYISLIDNSNISNTVSVVVSGAISGSDVRVSSNSNYILENSTETYSVFLYVGGVVTADVFSFSVANANVPSNHYVFSILGNNSFSIKNLELYLDNTLDILCVTGSISKTISVLLRGAW